MYPELEHRGQFGDSYGAINALFSGLALTLIAWSVFLQRRDLQATLDELKRSAEAQEASKDVLEKQVTATREHSQATLLLTKAVGFSALLRREAQLAEGRRGQANDHAENAKNIQNQISALMSEVATSGNALSDPSNLDPKNGGL